MRSKAFFPMCVTLDGIVVFSNKKHEKAFFPITFSFDNLGNSMDWSFSQWWREYEDRTLIKGGMTAFSAFSETKRRTSNELEFIFDFPRIYLLL